MDLEGSLLFLIQGPLIGLFDGAAIDFGPLKQRVTLAILLVHVNRPTPTSILHEGLWGESGPPTALKSIQTYISALRKILSGYGLGDRISYVSAGYQLELRAGELDSLRFTRLARQGRAQLRDGAHAEALGLLEEALPLWRGRAFADLQSVPMLRAESERMEQRWLAVWEDWAEASLQLGNHRDALERLEDIVHRFPHRERLRRLYMLALYRAGRQAEALESYDELRVALAHDLGLDPSPAMAQFYRRVLTGDGNLEWREAQGGGLRSAEVVAHIAGTPRNVEDFSGRTAPLRELVSRFTCPEPGRVVVISGPGGVGKSTLALRAAHAVREQYPQGQVLVSMRHPDGRRRTEHEAVSELIWKVDDIGTSPRTANVLGSVAGGPGLLMILDGAFDEGMTRLLLTWSAACNVIVTSTRRMSGLEAARHLDLKPFSGAESLALLLRVSGSGTPAAGDRTLERIVTACGGLSAAIRIAGARLSAHRHVNPAHLADRLEDDGAVLDELVAGDTDVRSYLARHAEELRPDELALLARLEPITGAPFTVEDVMEVMDVDVAEAQRVLERLIEAGVITTGWDAGGRIAYGMPRLLRIFLAHDISPARH